MKPLSTATPSVSQATNLFLSDIDDVHGPIVVCNGGTAERIVRVTVLIDCVRLR